MMQILIDFLFSTRGVFAASPEMCITFFACFMLIIDLFLSPQKRWITYGLAQFSLLAASLLTIKRIGKGPEITFYNSFILDDMGNTLKLVLYSLMAFVLIYARTYLKKQDSERGEYYTLSLFALLGMMILISSQSFLTLYLGLELISLPTYALIVMVKDYDKRTEAAMKYFVMGAMASAMLLYGISLLYGVTNSFDMIDVARSFAARQEPFHVVLLGMVFVIVGLGFKLGAVPFHLWIPDVYEGSPAPVTLFISTLSKVAGFGMAVRVLMNTFPSLDHHWQDMILAMALLSLVAGNIGAIVQTNLKRMLAYSTIGHMGFLFLGLYAAPADHYFSAMVYMIIYALMALAAFGMITLLSKEGIEAEHINDFKGLGKAKPWLGFLMVITLFSLTGVPPTIGFYAKFVVLQSLIEAGFVWLAVFAVIFAVIGAFYYLRVVRVMFFETPHTHVYQYPTITLQDNFVATINGLALLVLGIYPAPIIYMVKVAL